jgi:triosephosphate isomerase
MPAPPTPPPPAPPPAALMPADQAAPDATSFNFAAQEATSGSHIDVAIAPPLPYLPLVKPLLKGWTLAAQNCSAQGAGAFTGEVCRA